MDQVELQFTRSNRLRLVELLPRHLWDTAREAGLAIACETVGSITRGLNRREHHDGLVAEVFWNCSIPS